MFIITHLCYWGLLHNLIGEQHSSHFLLLLPYADYAKKKGKKEISISDYYQIKLHTADKSRKEVIHQSCAATVVCFVWIQATFK